jgi:hypothetical protein
MPITSSKTKGNAGVDRSEICLQANAERETFDLSFPLRRHQQAFAEPGKRQLLRHSRCDPN